MQLVNTRCVTADAGHQERDRRFQLARVLKVTSQMLQHARAADWPQVEELEALRRLELDSCLAMPDSAPSPEVAEALVTLLELNNQLVSIVTHARGKMTEEQGAHRTTVTAVRAYGGDSA